MPIVPFGSFAPDRSRFDPQASTSITNARPTLEGWGPLKDLNPVSGALAAKPQGAFAVKSDAGTWFIFIGTASNLYRVNSTNYTFDEVSVSTGAYSLADSEAWSFDKWGNYLIATAVGSTYPQVYDLSSGSGTFANLTNATFEARYVKAIGDFLVFACIDGDNRKLKWSAINDDTGWTDGVAGADSQTLPAGGDIQGIIPQAQNALIFQQNTIKQMQFAPDSGVVFRFSTIDPDRGVYAPRSLVNIGSGDFVYLAKNGFFRGVQATPIGAQRVDKWFFDNAQNPQYTSGVADPYQKIVWWRWTDATGTNFLLGYDYQLDKWMYSTAAAVELMEAATVGYVLEDLDTFGNMDTLAYSLDSRFWQGGVPGFAGFDATYHFGFFDGDNLEALIDTEDKMLNYPRRAITDRMSVLSDTNSAQIAIAAKENQGGTLTFGSYMSQESGKPWVSGQVSGRYHRFRVKIPAATTWNHAIGLDVAFTDGGLW